VNSIEHEGVRLLTDPDFIPPPAQDGPPGGIRWLRANVARFSSGEPHRRRRDLAAGLLAAIDRASLRERARELAAALRAAGFSVGDIARHVPVTALGEALGLADTDAAAVRTVAAHYRLDTDDSDADAAVALLVKAFGGVADESTAAGIGLLVQACDATAGLIDNAVRRSADTGESAEYMVAETILNDPPVRATVRKSLASGALVPVDLSVVPFGAGAHHCPGADHAVAIAIGVCEVLRDAA
jgi:cytochrome P450